MLLEKGLKKSVMEIKIGTNLMALDDLMSRAKDYCKLKNIDREEMLKPFQTAWKQYKGNKALIYANVLQSITRELVAKASAGTLSMDTAELMNNFCLALACIEEVSQKELSNEVFREMIDGPSSTEVSQ